MCDQKGIPFVGFGNDTLAGLVEVFKGDTIVCSRCEGTHELRCGKDANGDECCLLMFYTCGDKSYLGSIDGRLVVGIKSDISGSLPTEEV